MTTRTHVHEESFDVSQEHLFSILHTPSAIREWWSASHAIVIPEPNGIWAATWGESIDQPDYTTAATIGKFSAPTLMVLQDYRYRSSSGPLPFEAEFVTTFEVSKDGDRAKLRVTQEGFPVTPDADEFYKGCQQGWKDTFDGIRRYLEHTEDGSVD